MRISPDRIPVLLFADTVYGTGRPDVVELPEVPTVPTLIHEPYSDGTVASSTGASTQSCPDGCPLLGILTENGSMPIAPLMPIVAGAEVVP